MCMSPYREKLALHNGIKMVAVALTVAKLRCDKVEQNPRKRRIWDFGRASSVTPHAHTWNVSVCHHVKKCVECSGNNTFDASVILFSLKNAQVVRKNNIFQDFQQFQRMTRRHTYTHGYSMHTLVFRRS